MTTTSPPVPARSVRSVNPLVGVAARPGPEQEYHDAAFHRLVEATDPQSWSIFGEVPSPVGSIDILAIQGRGEWRALATSISCLDRSKVDGLSRLQRGRKYRKSTILRLADLDEDSFGKLRQLHAFIAHGGLWSRSDLPSDHVRRLVAYEVKAAEFPRGVVQAGRRRAVATETWLVVPSEATAGGLSPRTWDLVQRCGIGMRSADLKIFHPAVRGRRPTAIVINRMLRTVAQMAGES